MDVLSSLKAMQVNTGGRRDSLGSISSSTSAPAKDKDFSSALRQSSSDSSKQTLEKNYKNPNAKDLAAGIKSAKLEKNTEVQQAQPQHEGSKLKNSPEEKVDSLPNRIALQLFMRKMKEDVGVEASEITAAMKSLSIEELGLPPAENIEKILAQLGLNGEQKAQAEALFENLLKQTASTTFADHLKTSERELSMQVFSERELREKTMKEALARMNESFFVDPKAVQQSKLAVDQEAQTEGDDESHAAGALFGIGSTGAAIGSAATASGGSATGAAGAGLALAGNGINPVTDSGTAIPEGMTAVTPQEVVSNEALTESLSTEPAGFETLSEDSIVGEGAPRAASEVSEAKKLENFKSLEDQLRGFKLENMQGKTVAPKNAQIAYDLASAKNISHLSSQLTSQAAPSVNASLMQAPTGEAAAGAAAGLGAAVAGLERMAASDESSSEGSEGEAFSDPQAFTLQGDNKSLKGLEAQKFQVTMQPTASEENANIKELINKAQFLSTKGGGEMKIALSPEGLGEVVMKVSVNSGQVNVEMMAESNEAKKLLEKGMGELKATLASHKLNVENIKVDFQGGEIAKQFEDSRQHAERQFAQEFLENFRQQNGGWRRGFTDIGSARSRVGLDDKETDVRIAQAGANKKRTDKRLDLVA